ncbi:hypothetical protein [Brevundimonas lutea]|uniref:hypothetical protein n=1 Tax=Brevundimonas lutea TaxID=2293980 RepID=UPI000F0370C2|nr:hypothetical protein [Brevundimonas lutea]
MSAQREDDDIDAPYARKIQPEGGKPDQLKGKTHGADDDHQEDLIDESVDETFPASDPPAAKKIT